jgi:hypothetical protein
MIGTGVTAFLLLLWYAAPAENTLGRRSRAGSPPQIRKRRSPLRARRTTYFACAPYEVGTYQAKQQSNGDEQHPITHDKTNNAVRSCAKSHPEGDLVRAIRYGKRHNPIDAKRCQE